MSLCFKRLMIVNMNVGVQQSISALLVSLTANNMQIVRISGGGRCTGGNE